MSTSKSLQEQKFALSEYDYVTMSDKGFDMSKYEVYQRIEPDSLAQQIRAARINAGLTQTKAATATGHTQAYISKIEAGLKTPTVETIRHFCKAYECQIIISK